MCGVVCNVVWCDREPGAQCLCQIFMTIMSSFADPSVFPGGFAKALTFLSAGARGHPDTRSRQLCKFLLCSMTMAQPCYSHPDWDWDALFLDEDGQSNFLQQACEVYDFDSCHTILLREQGCWGQFLCCSLSFVVLPSKIPVLLQGSTIWSPAQQQPTLWHITMGSSRLQ